MATIYKACHPVPDAIVFGGNGSLFVKFWGITDEGKACELDYDFDVCVAEFNDTNWGNYGGDPKKLAKLYTKMFDIQGDKPTEQIESGTNGCRKIEIGDDKGTPYVWVAMGGTSGMCGNDFVENMLLETAGGQTVSGFYIPGAGRPPMSYVIYDTDENTIKNASMFKGIQYLNWGCTENTGGDCSLMVYTDFNGDKSQLNEFDENSERGSTTRDGHPLCVLKEAPMACAPLISATYYQSDWCGAIGVKIEFIRTLGGTASHWCHNPEWAGDAKCVKILNEETEKIGGREVQYNNFLGKGSYMSPTWESSMPRSTVNCTESEVAEWFEVERFLDKVTHKVCFDDWCEDLPLEAMYQRDNAKMKSTIYVDFNDYLWAVSCDQIFFFDPDSNSAVPGDKNSEYMRVIGNDLTTCVGEVTLVQFDGVGTSEQFEVQAEDLFINLHVGDVDQKSDEFSVVLDRCQGDLPAAGVPDLLEGDSTYRDYNGMCRYYSRSTHHEKSDDLITRVDYDTKANIGLSQRTIECSNGFGNLGSSERWEGCNEVCPGYLPWEPQYLWFLILIPILVLGAYYWVKKMNSKKAIDEIDQMLNDVLSQTQDDYDYGDDYYEDYYSNSNSNSYNYSEY